MFLAKSGSSRALLFDSKVNGMGSQLVIYGVGMEMLEGVTVSVASNSFCLSSFGNYC